MEENFRILKPYLRGLPFIILSLVVAFMVSKKYLNYVTPMYESTAKLRLADVNDGVPSSNLFKDLDVFTTANEIAAEIEVIKSEVLLDKVLDSLDFDMEVFRKGKIKTDELYHDSPLNIEYDILDPDAYDKLYEVKVLDKTNFQISESGSDVSQPGIIGDTLIFDGVMLRISPNPNYLMANPHVQIMDDYQFRILSRPKLIANVKSKLDVIAVDKDVAVLRINFKSPNPEKASILVNTLSEVYINDYIENKYKAANVTVMFLQEQINSVLAKLSVAENSIQNFREDKGVTNILQETETDLRKIAQLKIQQTNIKMNLDAIEELTRYIQEGQENFLELAPNFEAFTDLLSTEIIKEIKALQAKKRDLLITFTPNNEKVMVIDEKIYDLTSYLAESINNTYKNLRIKYDRITEEINRAETVFEVIPEKERMLKILNREFKIYQQSYVFLNEKRIEAEIAQAARISFHRIITYAQTPKDPISPNGIIILSVATILGLMGAVILIYIIHLVKAKVNDKQTVESNSMIPISMLTPLLKNKTVANNYFMQTALELEVKGLLVPKNIICFSSYKYKSGAEYISVNLAKTSAQQGMKVLIIDVEDKLDINPDSTGNIHDNLDIVSLSDDSFSYYTKAAMQNHLESLRKDYDVVFMINELIGTGRSTMFMSLSTVNIITLDTRKTQVKRITESDLLNEEYNLPSVYFALNRYGYNPNIVVDICKILSRIFNIKKRTK